MSKEELIVRNLLAALTEERDRLKEIVDGTGLATAAIAAERDRLALANAELLAGLKPLIAIAAAYDANELDDEARKWWTNGHNTTPSEQIELYQGRGGKCLLTLQHALDARALLDKHKATSTESE